MGAAPPAWTWTPGGGGGQSAGDQQLSQVSWWWSEVAGPEAGPDQAVRVGRAGGRQHPVRRAKTGVIFRKRPGCGVWVWGVCTRVCSVPCAPDGISPRTAGSRKVSACPTLTGQDSLL